MPYADSLGTTADYTDFTNGDCRGSRVGCFEMEARDAGSTPIRLRSGQAMPLQQDYFGASKARIFSKRGSPGNRCCLIWESNELFQLD
jgi:hypothetical protein